MKKIFAIALALTMVLSMGMASAFYCAGLDWSCATTTTRCGTATVDIVEYVKQTTACGIEYIPNSCAAAVKGEKIYYAIKINVPSDISEEWWNDAVAKGMEVSHTDVASTEGGANLGKVRANLPAFSTIKDGGVWFWKNDGTWVKEGSRAFDFSDGGTFPYIHTAWALANGAKVCVALEAKINGLNTAIKVGDYTITFHAGTGTDDPVVAITVVGKSYYADIILDADSKVQKIQVGANGSAFTKEYVGYDGSLLKFALNGGGFEDMGCAEAKFAKEVLDYFKLNFGTCITRTAVKNNFGFDDYVKDCTTYNSQATAIVDVNCEISIPKTGDVSVIAYAVMALVTAAGAVSLKK